MLSPSCGASQGEGAGAQVTHRRAVRRRGRAQVHKSHTEGRCAASQRACMRARSQARETTFCSFSRLMSPPISIFGPFSWTSTTKRCHRDSFCGDPPPSPPLPGADAMTIWRGAGRCGVLPVATRCRAIAAGAPGCTRKLSTPVAAAAIASTSALGEAPAPPDTHKPRRVSRQAVAFHTQNSLSPQPRPRLRAPALLHGTALECSWEYWVN
jgi:hypothetical protein